MNEVVRITQPTFGTDIDTGEFRAVPRGLYLPPFGVAVWHRYRVVHALGRAVAVDARECFPMRKGMWPW